MNVLYRKLIVFFAIWFHHLIFNRYHFMPQFDTYYKSFCLFVIYLFYVRYYFWCFSKNVSTLFFVLLLFRTENVSIENGWCAAWSVWIMSALFFSFFFYLNILNELIMTDMSKHMQRRKNKNKNKKTKTESKEGVKERKIKKKSRWNCKFQESERCTKYESRYKWKCTRRFIISLSLSLGLCRATLSGVIPFKITQMYKQIS